MTVFLFCAIFCLQLYVELSAPKPKIVCYWPNWRLGEGNGNKRHTPEDIDPTLCTHIHHAFHVLDVKNNVVKDSAGPQPQVYNRLLALKQKNPDLKIIISLGGAGQPDIDYSHLVNNQTLRQQFIKNTIQYLHKYKFDGLDIDWEYPVCWSGNCSKGPKSDKENFGNFVHELRVAFDEESPRFSLSAAVVAGVEGGIKTADHAYDFKLMASLDYICVMTYSLWGAWAHVTGHHSKFSSSKSAVQYFVNKGISKEKVLMGVAFYGHTFKLADKNKHNVGAPILGDGRIPGGKSYSGFYRDICALVKHNNWTKELSDNGHDPIAYHDDIWVGYDDPYAAYEKSKWVKDNSFGGIIIWEITQDDFKKTCCSIAYPMLNAINHGLYGTGKGPETYGCEHK